MSEIVETSGGSESQASGSESGKENNYPKHFVDKLLGEKKKAAAEAEELRKKVLEFENEKLQTQGKDKELIDALKKQNSENELKLKKATAQYAQNVIFNAIKAEAVKQGCLDPDALIKLADLDSIQVDASTFEVPADDLNRLVSTMKAEKTYLFKTQVAGVKDATPGATESKPLKLDVANMSKTLKQNDFKNILAMKLGKK